MHLGRLPRGLSGKYYKNPLWADNFIQASQADDSFEFRWQGSIYFPPDIDEFRLESNLGTAVYLDDILVEGPPSFLDLGRSEVRRFLDAGWSYDEKKQDSDVRFVWSSASSSTLFLKAEEKAEYQLNVRCVPLPYSGNIQQMITVKMDGVQIGTIPLQDGWNWRTYTLTIPPSAFAEEKPGLVMLTFLYAYTDVKNSRELAVAFDSVELRRVSPYRSNETDGNSKQPVVRGGIRKIFIKGQGSQEFPFLRLLLDRKGKANTTFPEGYLFPANISKEQIVNRVIPERRILGGLIVGKLLFICYCLGIVLMYFVRKKPVTRIRGLVWGILLLSLFLRLFLVSRGGQFYWPDENLRYVGAHQAVQFAFSEQFAAALRYLFGAADHIGFKMMLVLPVALEHVAGQNPKIPAMFLSLFAVMNLWLLRHIALRAGASEREALLAVFLASVSTTLLFYSRHLLPYDPAMTFGLLTLLAALKQPVRAWDSLLCGILGSVTFLTYNGYWILGAFVLLLHVLYKASSLKNVVFRSVFSAAGLFFPIGLLLSLSSLLEADLLGSFLKFSKTVTQGDFNEGWLLPLKYFWHTEHFLLALWGGAILFFIFHVFSGKREERAILWFLGLVFIYGILVIFSVGLEKFVVYGRLSRQLLPFFCLLGAYALEQFHESHVGAAKVVMAICFLAVLQAAFNFSQPLTQVFPREFLSRARSIAPLDSGEYRLVYTEHIYPAPKKLALPAHTVLLRKRHPLQYLPYQYEGYSREQRGLLRETDISMRVIQFEKNNKYLQ